MDIPEQTSATSVEPGSVNALVVITDVDPEAQEEAPAELSFAQQQLARAKDFLAKHFRPALDASTCSVMLTTDQVHDRIESHSPGEIPKQVLVSALRESGYPERYIGVEFKWLMNLATAA